MDSISRARRARSILEKYKGRLSDPGMITDLWEVHDLVWKIETDLLRVGPRGDQKTVNSEQ